MSNNMPHSIFCHFVKPVVHTDMNFFKSYACF